MLKENVTTPIIVQNKSGPIVRPMLRLGRGAVCRMREDRKLGEGMVLHLLELDFLGMES